MGLLRRIIGALTGNLTPRAEDIVFEPIDGPNLSSAAVRDVLVEAPRGSVFNVPLGEVMERVPSDWKRSGEFVAEQMLELPPAARMNLGAERPLAFSLRYLATLYPRFFRDPGVHAKDVGVDLAMEPLREPEPVLEDLPVEVLQEFQGESETFTEWEGEIQTKSARTKEAKATERALKKVEMPVLKGADSVGFDDLLDVEGEKPQIRSELAGVPAIVPPLGQPVNGRLRQILEAYAEGLPDAKKTPLIAARPIADKKVEDEGREIIPKVRLLTRESADEISVPVLQSFSSKAAEGSLQSSSVAAVGDFGSEPPALQQTRFNELGLSLSRFPEVRGFALWLGDHAMQTGEMGLDTQSPATRFRMEKILESASLTQGAQDGFLSITVFNARGGLSIFGGGSCLVAVSHQGEGMPAHLRSWLCGWVSQPLRT